MQAVKRAVRDLDALMPAYHVQVKRPLRQPYMCDICAVFHYWCLSLDIECRYYHHLTILLPEVMSMFVQERLLDDDSQMWLSFKERLMYWERETSSSSSWADLHCIISKAHNVTQAERIDLYASALVYLASFFTSDRCLAGWCEGCQCCSNLVALTSLILESAMSHYETLI